MPKYQKGFEAAFFAMFLILYYAVLAERNPEWISPVEVLLYIWIAAFAYDEIGEYQDAGRSFYATDFWSLWDIGIIAIGIAYIVLSESRDLLDLRSVQGLRFTLCEEVFATHEPQGPQQCIDTGLVDHTC